MIKGLFFDLDGVLIDSEYWHQQLNAKCLKELNCTDIDPRAFYALIGSGKGIDAWEMIYQRIPEKYRQMNFKETFRDYKSKQFDYPPFSEIIFPEVSNVLQELKKEGYQLACCSSSKEDYIQKALEECKISHLFDLVISGHDFALSKPNPEIYLTAMTKLGLDNRQCAVIEDSSYGIEAGKNAKMVVIARKDRHFGLDQSKADYIIDDLAKIKDVMKKLGGNE